jgi:sugar O-acyltransferase (sialic acid O-acetyltransferase NeuD family)
MFGAKENVVVIGAGGHAKVVISTLRTNDCSIAAVFDDDSSLWETELLDVPIRGPVAMADQSGFLLGIVAIGDNAVRQRIARSLNLHWPTLVHSGAWVDPDAKLGAGTVVFAGAVIQPGSVVGEHVIVNTSASVDHDCVVEDFVHLAPGVHLGGNVQIGEGAFLGIGSGAIPGRRVGAWTTVGAGAVVVRDLPKGVVAYGVPARPARPSGCQPANAPRCRVLRTSQQQEWLEVLGGVVRHDFHHLPQYQRVEEHRLNATAQLFTYGEGDYLIALPLLLRPVGEALAGWQDATSVYGYSGPVASHEHMPKPVVRNFQAALREALAERRVIAAFSRLHPLIAQYNSLAGLGECRGRGQTVSIDLTLPPDEQRAQYRSTYKRRISRQQRDNTLTCLHDQDKCFLGDFASIYEETMRRVKAEDSYFFGVDYFRQLACELGPVLQLFVALIGGKVAAAGLFTICNGVVQYHLGGTRDEFLKLSPMLLIFEAVRLWANGIGARVFHLGGGVGGANDDSLFHYKAGFSDRRHHFATWQWIVSPEMYREVCERRARMQPESLELMSADYFPAYRCPAVPRAWNSGSRGSPAKGVCHRTTDGS